MEDITAKAIPQLGEAVDASVVHDDWIVNFFDKSPIVSDKQMQDLWASSPWQKPRCIRPPMHPA